MMRRGDLDTQNTTEHEEAYHYNNNIFTKACAFIIFTPLKIMASLAFANTTVVQRPLLTDMFWQMLPSREERRFLMRDQEDITPAFKQKKSKFEEKLEKHFGVDENTIITLPEKLDKELKPYRCNLTEGYADDLAHLVYANGDSSETVISLQALMHHYKIKESDLRKCSSANNALYLPKKCLCPYTRKEVQLVRIVANSFYQKRDETLKKYFASVQKNGRRSTGHGNFFENESVSTGRGTQDIFEQAGMPGSIQFRYT